MRSKLKGITLVCFILLTGFALATVSPTRTPTFHPTLPTMSPTHGPTNLPSKAPTWSPTITVNSDQDIKIVATVTLQGEEITDLCAKPTLEDYELSLESVFVAASGVSSADIRKIKITDCENANDNEATLTYQMRSADSRSKNTVTQRVQDGRFLSTYQENLNLVFNDVQAESVSIVEADAAEKENNSKGPFHDFFSQSFGLGVVIVLVSLVWLWFLKSDQTEGKTRLTNLQREKHEFESKYGKLEPISNANENQTANMVQMVENTKSAGAASYDQETNM